MFVLGHMGIGSTLARPLAKGLPFGWLLVGTVLPDLIDKPLYYGLMLATGRHAAEIGLISGTRTFGHTGLLVLSLVAVAFLRRSKVLAALGLGVATHIALDAFAEALTVPLGERTLVWAIFFPAYGLKFPVMPHRDVAAHLGTFWQSHIFWGEIVGGFLLGIRLLFDARRVKGKGRRPKSLR